MAVFGGGGAFEEGATRRPVVFPPSSLPGAILCFLLPLLILLYLVPVIYLFIYFSACLFIRLLRLSLFSSIPVSQINRGCFLPRLDFERIFNIQCAARGPRRSTVGSEGNTGEIQNRNWVLSKINGWKREQEKRCGWITSPNLTQSNQSTLFLFAGQIKRKIRRFSEPENSARPY